MMPRNYKPIYSETSRKQVKTLHPQVKPAIKSSIEMISKNPYIGKYLERELAGYLSYRTKRYRIIYKIVEEKYQIEVHYIGHRKDIYELFGDLIKKNT